LSALDTELLRAWLRSEPHVCADALPRLAADDREALLVAVNADELERIVKHAPVWWLASTISDHVDLDWSVAIGQAGAHPNVIHTLRVLSHGVREALLARVPPRPRTRIHRALALPKDRVWSILDEHVRVCHPDELVTNVVQRFATDQPTDDPWVYVTNVDDHYVGQLPILSLVQATPDVPVRDIPFVDRPRISAALLLTDALRRANWQDFDSLPAQDEQGRFAGVLRLGALARALGFDDTDTTARPFSLVSALLSLWTQLLITFISRASRAGS
jgi:Mg/Co/Ni transporter MgtE